MKYRCVQRGRVYQVVVRSFLFYGCETWLVPAAKERMLAVFDNDSICHFLHVWRRDCAAASALIAYRHS